MAYFRPYVKVDKATGKKTEMWRAEIRRQGFAAKSAIFATKTEAKNWARDNEATSTLKKARSSTAFEKVVDLMAEAPPGKGWKFWKPDHLDFWRDEFRGRPIGELAHGEINAAAAKLQTKLAMRSSPSGPVATGKPVTPATVNRYLASLASVFNFALRRQIIDAHPMKGGKVQKLTESGGRRRVLEPAEEARLYQAAKGSSWPMLYLFVLTAMTTGARKSEILRLKWGQVDLDRAIAVLGKTKNGRPRALPLVSEVRALLADAAKVKPLKGDFVFFDPARPERPKNIDSVWTTCRKAAGLLNDREDPLERVVLHSTRHTAVTKLLRGGANLAQAAAVSGHQTLAMLKRYEHLAAADSVDLAERLLSGKGGK